MEQSSELARLEQFVDKLLSKYNELKENYKRLQQTLRERDQECASLKDQVEELKSERSFVGERVAGLIDRIEQWEAEQQADPSETAPAGGQEDASRDGEQTPLFGSASSEI